jgi:hypothetical protein
MNARTPRRKLSRFYRGTYDWGADQSENRTGQPGFEAALLVFGI